MGAQRGGLAATLNKVSNIHNKSGPFDCCLLLGDVCAKDDPSLEPVLAGAPASAGGLASPLPLTCYFTMGGQALPPQVCDRIESNHGEVVPNLIFLGQSAALLVFNSFLFNIWPAITKRNAIRHFFESTTLSPLIEVQFCWSRRSGTRSLGKTLGAPAGFPIGETAGSLLKRRETCFQAEGPAVLELEALRGGLWILGNPA